MSARRRRGLAHGGAESQWLLHCGFRRLSSNSTGLGRHVHVRVFDCVLCELEQGHAALLSFLLRIGRVVGARVQSSTGPRHVHLSKCSSVSPYLRANGGSNTVAVADSNARPNDSADDSADARSIAGAVGCTNERAHWRTECIADASSNSGAYSGAKRGSVICTESSFDTGS